MAARQRRRHLNPRERRHRVTAVLVAVVGGIASLWLAATVLALLTGHGWQPPALQLRSPFTGAARSDGLLGLPHYSDPAAAAATPSPSSAVDREGATAAPMLQAPFTLTWPVSIRWSVAFAAALWAVWLHTVVRWKVGGRDEGLAVSADVRRVLGAGQARENGKVTWPTTRRWVRAVMATSAFGYPLGRMLRASGGRRVRLWARFETNVRIIAHSGWGKTLRLLVPIVRQLPGAALVSTNEQQLFTHTVLARRYRRPPVRWPVLRLLPRNRRVTEYPVLVADFSDPDNRWAAGFEQVRWNPIPGCEDHFVAVRRAHASVEGAESSEGDTRGSSKDKFWRHSATEVIAAWLHAAALGGYELDDIQEWLGDTGHPTPRRILADDHRADPTALTSLTKHLDQRAEGTTSGVERYITLAINALVSREGRRFCGSRTDGNVDMAGLINAGGTVYVLADDERIGPVRPLLSLFAAEMLLAARRAALTHPDARLPIPFVAVLDELRYSVVVPNLPYIGNTGRKHGISFVYSVQGSTQEDELYGAEAGALRQSVSINLIGGLDMSVAPELSTRAGSETVVDRARNANHGEHISRVDVLPVSDQQRMRLGQAIIAARGAGLFLAYAPKIHDHYLSYRRIRREVTQVQAIIRTARHRDCAGNDATRAAATAGSGFLEHGDAL